VLKTGHTRVSPVSGPHPESYPKSRMRRRDDGSMRESAVTRSAHFLPALEAVRGALPPCGEAVRLRFLPFAVGCVVGPELERAQVVPYHANLTHACGRLLAPSARTLRCHGRSLGLGEVFEALAVVYRRVPAPFARI
jgi:hypothetical protein